MSKDVKPIEKAGLLPTAVHIEKFAAALKQYDGGFAEDDGLRSELSIEGGMGEDLHKTLNQFSEMATLKGKKTCAFVTPY